MLRENEDLTKAIGKADTVYGEYTQAVEHHTRITVKIGRIALFESYGWQVDSVVRTTPRLRLYFSVDETA